MIVLVAGGEVVVERSLMRIDEMQHYCGCNIAVLNLHRYDAECEGRKINWIELLIKHNNDHHEEDGRTISKIEFNINHLVCFFCFFFLAGVAVSIEYINIERINFN